MTSKKADQINDLSRQILQVCAQCGHGHWQGSSLTCDRKKSECHSGRVRKWLAEIGKLEGDKKHDQKP